MGGFGGGLRDKDTISKSSGIGRGDVMGFLDGLNVMQTLLYLGSVDCSLFV